jgi:A-macroglobulin TED domain/Alpha-2-macroglobulin family/MG2 domain/Carboxypeptidase regulatory-like domain/A-macroglobulin receptor binding domain/Alpha-2-macroglobulin bait region domain/Macroglobulin domain MG3
MSRKGLLSLIGLTLPLLLLVQIASARFELRVNETSSRLSLRGIAPAVSLVVENGTGKPVQALIRLELLDPNNNVKASTQQDATLKPGSHKLIFALPLKTRDLSPAEEDRVLWYRLHYHVVAEPYSDYASLDGFISLSEITPDLFELSLASVGIARGGMRYQARARAVHPITLKPAAGVEINGLVTLTTGDSDEETKLSCVAVTDNQGYADLSFKLPLNLLADEMELTIVGKRGALTVSAEKEILLDNKPRSLVSTDKPLYQPGQTLHARVLVFGPNKRAIPGKAVTLRITDPDDTVIFSSDLETSRFGIATVDWPIPDNTRLGDYQLAFLTDHEVSNTAFVKISRYELPNFTITAKPDRSYYLDDQDATIEVRADYLFGQRVLRGHVRVVRETERIWNYREQKYETEEGDAYEGDTGPDATFRARIDLKKDHSELQENDYQRFVDLPYAIYFTDSTTNRTEQRRCNLRITKQDIHIYVIRPDGNYYDSSRLPLRFYVSTFYADGSPAQCTVKIKTDSSEDPSGKSHLLAKPTTNRYGLATVEGLKLPAGSDHSELTLNLLAQDRSGRVGKHAESYVLRDQPAIQLETGKTLFASGESIAVTITSSEKDLPVVLDVIRDWSVIHSKKVRLNRGRAFIVLPYEPDYRDEIVLAAYADQNPNDTLVATRSILFPRNRDLKLNLRPKSRAYKPGEQAHMSFRALDPEGRPVESALGVVVLDEAVEERVRTDQEFGSRYAGFYGNLTDLIGSGDSVGAVTRKSLEHTDMSKPVTRDLDLAAEVLLNQDRNYYPELFSGDDYEKNQASVFSALVSAQIEPLRAALTRIYDATGKYPTNESTLRQMLSASGIDFTSLKDPWGKSYRPLFFVDRQVDVLLLKSAGSDKQFDTDDDFSVTRLSWVYFRPIGEAIDTTIRRYHQSTGGFIRDYETLAKQLLLKGIDLESESDPWDKPYKFAFDIQGNDYVIRVSATTPATRYENRNYPETLFTVWESRINYFAETQARIDNLLTTKLGETGHFPLTESELRNSLRGSVVELDDLRDPWGKSYYLTFETHDFYGDNVKIESQSAYGQATTTQRLIIKPATKRLIEIKLRSAGPDLREGTPDDFTAAAFSATLSEQIASDTTSQPAKNVVNFSGSTGAIEGLVKDPQDASVTGVKVTATRTGSSDAFTNTTDDSGRYLLRNLPPGIYQVRFDLAGFKTHVVTNVFVRSSSVLDVSVMLDPGAVSETVTVTAGRSDMSFTESASVSSTVSRATLFAIAPSLAARQQLSTPRLREFFPETLVWQPELTTDKQGRAQLDFKLADNITTWKMSVIGSTEDGEIGTADTELRAFQPFFAELDPPRVLTQGDRISLPVVMRNYLEKKQSVDLELKLESWFTLLGPNRKSAEVSAGDSTMQTFDLRTVASVKDGTQRVTAFGSDESDAIEKPVTVHPDGEEKAETTSDLLENATTLTVDLPAQTIANSAQLELKIYPNLMAHVWESIEGIMKRPYGCGEQTISSTYPSLLLLRYLKSEHQDSPVAAKARRYLQAGYQRLLSYQSEDGGFSYWGRGDSDIALTAYALRFLRDAAEITTVDENVSAKARTWLIKEQQADGRWQARSWSNSEDARRTAMLTAVVARSLAPIQKVVEAVGASLIEPTKSDEHSALKKALDYLEKRSEEIDEPYLLATYSLASFAVGDLSRAERASSRLKILAHSEGSSSYWALETNTPFYGWGLAGRIETTALAVQALTTLKPGGTTAEQTDKDLSTRGLLFLLRSKDRYGVWYSTQATINVLDAMMSLLSSREAARNREATTVNVLVNGLPAASIALPSGNRTMAPLSADLSRFIRSGRNQIELRRSGSGPVASLQSVATYYVPWTPTVDQKARKVGSGDSESLRLETSFDKTEARVTEEITCRVKAERIGFRGYGMMLAEIGLPPGVDVDRASLETALRGSDWSVNQYDVLPDRVVFYLWPRAGGSTFSFKFKPRMAMTAKAAASVLYDYYNPEARAVLAPGTFLVK